MMFLCQVNDGVIPTRFRSYRIDKVLTTLLFRENYSYNLSSLWTFW